MPHARAPPPAGPWAWAWAWQAGRRRASGQAGVARFCHLILIITGVSLFYGGDELIASVTVSSCLRLLSSSASFLPPRCWHKLEILRQSNPSFASEKSHLSRLLAFPVMYLCAHGATGEQVLPEPSSACEPCTGCAVIRFLGSDYATAHPTSSSW